MSNKYKDAKDCIKEAEKCGKRIDPRSSASSECSAESSKSRIMSVLAILKILKERLGETPETSKVEKEIEARFEQALNAGTRKAMNTYSEYSVALMLVEIARILDEKLEKK